MHCLLLGLQCMPTTSKIGSPPMLASTSTSVQFREKAVDVYRLTAAKPIWAALIGGNRHISNIYVMLVIVTPSAY